jgi:hypothetical protein
VSGPEASGLQASQGAVGLSGYQEHMLEEVGQIHIVDLSLVEGPCVAGIFSSFAPSSPGGGF